MSSSVEDFRKNAKMLQAEARKYPREEIRTRVALSRSYYAAYQACFEWHKALPPKEWGRLVSSTEKSGSHAQLIDRLFNPAYGSTQGRTDGSRDLARWLVFLRSLREKSDYDLAAALEAKDLDDAEMKLDDVCTLIRSGVK